ncbi:hypothetical protein [Ornithinibacillus halotolerans]|uniref:PTS cellobiose transporter subunit IIA n=1 Tax=Ornithinibacillus halotolerans TaxID=1274357 RepID=A0A916WF87_9BACI|nr:hypothetical protein [Ornithinibacillus halotolerans]GGA92129.1 hypothetical protein GCM10008025_38240 [Ornithinibacillus halotolerans]
MKTDGMALYEQNRKKLSVKTMYFNRYLLVRYVSALFFFTNLYWLISLVMSDSSLFIIPLAVLIVFVIAAYEQVKLYSSHTNDAKLTKFSIMFQLITNIALLLPTYFSSTFTKLYPFLIDQVPSKLFVTFFLVIGILFSLILVKRLNKIKRNEDKHYQRIKEYEAIINKK